MLGIRCLHLEKFLHCHVQRLAPSLRQAAGRPGGKPGGLNPHRFDRVAQQGRSECLTIAGDQIGDGMQCPEPEQGICLREPGQEDRQGLTVGIGAEMA